jgi:hypothetical protein
MERKGWKVTIKEVGRPNPVESENWNSTATYADMVKFYGCKESDVEWYKIEPIER